MKSALGATGPGLPLGICSPGHWGSSTKKVVQLLESHFCYPWHMGIEHATSGSCFKSISASQS